MVNKRLFGFAGKAKPADVMNEAGGKAYAFSPEHALAQYAVTGTMHNTFYATAEEQLDTILALADACSPEFVAKTAIYCREKGFMKDVPALLVAYLSKRDVALMKIAFARVIDNGKMLRNFVKIVRSGRVGRKSFGSAPKRMAQAWFAKRSPETIFKGSIGSDPSMSDVIKMIRPAPKDEKGEKDVVREALYGYLIGKLVERDKLPKVVQELEAFKASPDTAPLPNVPFEMLTALDLTTKHWIAIAKNMTWTQTRMNLNTLLRKGVLEDVASIELVAKRLSDAEAIRRARALPYQLLAAYKAAGTDMPNAITRALEDALEIATENVPQVPGKVFVCPDVSGSMQSPVTGYRRGATTSVRCVDVAGLVAASFMRRNPETEVIPFSDDVVPMPRKPNPRDSVMTNAQYLASLPSGGTSCSAPLRFLNRYNRKGDVVVFVSDNQSWVDFGTTRSTVMAEEWEKFKARNPNAKIVLVDIQPYAHTQIAERRDVLNVGGFSDAVFDIVSLFAKGELSSKTFVDAIQSVKL